MSALDCLHDVTINVLCPLLCAYCHVPISVLIIVITIIYIYIYICIYIYQIKSYKRISVEKLKKVWNLRGVPLKFIYSRKIHRIVKQGKSKVKVKIIFHA